MADRVAVIGDVGGHVDALQAELIRLGADPVTGDLPAGLVVVQVGDLIHRGPDSAGVVALVDRYLAEQPAQWVQLAGNHEAQYLRAPAFEWPERLPAGPVATLRGWWRSGRMVAAMAIETPAERFLVTHAGLTSGFWKRVLGSNDQAAQVAAALNSFIGTHEDVLFKGGQMLGGGRPDALAGPLWASAGNELLPSWADRVLPFSQIHGHSIGAGVDAVTRHQVTEYDGGRIIGVDPGHSRRARASWQALVLDGPVKIYAQGRRERADQ